jgi:hypothetical protein
MNKKIITALVCMHLGVTPTAHAWQLPATIDNKKIGIVAGITAVLLTLVGLTCYLSKKRGQSVPMRALQPRAGIEDAAGQGAAPSGAQAVLPAEALFLEVTTAQEALKNRVTALETGKDDLRGDVAFLTHQLAQALKTNSENEQIMRDLQADVGRFRQQMQEFTLMTGGFMRRLGDLEQSTRHMRLGQVLADKQSTQATPDKIQMHQLQQDSACITGLKERGLLAKLISPSRPKGGLPSKTKADFDKEKQAVAAPPAQATIPDAQVHSGSEMGPLVSQHSVAEPLLSPDAIQQIAATPLKEGQDFASLSPSSKAFYAASTPVLPVLKPVVEEGVVAAELPEATDFGCSLTAAQGERVEALL